VFATAADGHQLSGVANLELVGATIANVDAVVIAVTRPALSDTVAVGPGAAADRVRLALLLVLERGFRFGG
jgi:hypothetical protein